VLEQCIPPEEREDLLTETAKRMIAGAGTLPANHKDRMDGMLAFLNRQGFVARWEKDGDGRYLIYISSCPYHYVAQSHLATCDIDKRMIQMLTGGDVTRIQGSAHQGSLCIYEVKWATS